MLSKKPMPLGTYPEPTPKRGEERLAVTKAALAKHGANLSEEGRRILEWAISRQEALNKAAAKNPHL
jgi:hypothetical protein